MMKITHLQVKTSLCVKHTHYCFNLKKLKKKEQLFFVVLNVEKVIKSKSIYKCNEDEFSSCVACAKQNGIIFQYILVRIFKKNVEKMKETVFLFEE